MTLLGFKPVDALREAVESGGLRRPFFILWGIFGIFYFSELAHFSLSIDEESAILRQDAAVWAQQDRWLDYIIEQFILTAPVVPFFPLFLFGALASLGYMIVARTHHYPLQDGRVLLASLLFSAFPILYFMLDFSAATVSIGVALLLSCLCLLLFDRALRALTEPQAERRGLIGLFIAQALLGAAAIGAYQSLILLVAAGCGGVFLLRYLRGPALSVRHILVIHAWLASSLLAGIVLSFLMSRGLQWIVGIQHGYIGHYVAMDQMAAEPLSVLKKLAKQYWAVYGGKRGAYGLRFWTFPALLLLGMIAVATRAPQRKPAAILFVILYMIGITLIPFALNVIAGGKLPYRVLIAVPYVFWFFAAAALFSQVAALRRIAVVLTVIVVIQCLYIFSVFQAQKRLVLDHDKLLASEIYQRIVGEIPDFDRSKAYTVDFYGAHEFQSVYKEIDDSTWSASFFEWDGGNPGRIVNFMRILGYTNLVPASRPEQKILSPAFQDMPIWPAAGSVRVADGIVLVRLGQKPGLAHRQE